MFSDVYRNYENLGAGGSIKDLIDFQSDNKYLLMACSQEGQKRLGRMVAGAGRLNEGEFRSLYIAYGNELAGVLDSRISRGHMINMLQHVYGYFKDRISESDKNRFFGMIENYRNGNVAVKSLLDQLQEWAWDSKEEYILRQTIFEVDWERQTEPEVHLDLLDVEGFSEVVDWNKGTDEDFLYQWSGKGYAYPVDVTQYEKRLEEGVNATGGRSLVFGVYTGSGVGTANSRRLVGTIELAAIDHVKKMAIICRVLIGREEDRGKGYGQKAIEMISEKAFTELGLKMLFLKVFDSNVGAVKCYEKAGFKIIKHEPDAYKTQDGWWGRYTMVKTSGA